MFSTNLCTLPFAGLLGLAALPALSQTPAPTEAERSVLTRIVDVVCVDMVAEEPGCELAVLMQSETLDGMADLHIRSARGDILVVGRDFVFSGAFDGQRPSLGIHEDGRLLVHSEQFAVGRTPWTQTLTIQEYDGALRVTGYSHSLLDRPAGGDYGCDVNLLTGAWRASATRIDTESGATTQTWDDTGLGPINPTEILWWGGAEPPAHCDDIMMEWFAAAP